MTETSPEEGGSHRPNRFFRPGSLLRVDLARSRYLRNPRRPLAVFDGKAPGRRAGVRVRLIAEQAQGARADEQLRTKPDTGRDDAFDGAEQTSYGSRLSQEVSAERIFAGNPLI